MNRLLETKIEDKSQGNKYLQYVQEINRKITSVFLSVPLLSDIFYKLVKSGKVIFNNEDVGHIIVLSLVCGGCGLYVSHLLKKLKIFAKDQEYLLTHHKILFDNDAIGLIYVKNRIIELANDRICKLFGYEKKELEGDICKNIFGQVDNLKYEECLKLFVNGFKDKGYYESEHTIKTKQGENIRVNIIGYPIDKNDLSKGIIWSFKDVTGNYIIQQQYMRVLNNFKKKDEENSSLLLALKAILINDDFRIIAKEIFSIAKNITGATAGYVALLSKDGNENEVLFLDSGGRKCNVDPNLPMPIRGLREISYTENRVVYDNSFGESQWLKYMPKGHVKLDNVLFAPLIIDGKTVGIMGLANKKGGFDQNDERITGILGEYVSIALMNSRNLEQLKESMQECKYAQESALEATIAKTQFLAHMSHELRSPLNSIYGAYQLLDMLDLTDEQRTYIEVIGKSSSVLLKLISDVLDLSKIEAGKMELYKTQIDLNTIIKDIYNISKLQVEKKGIEFLLDLKESPNVFGDETRIKQIILNLVSNAIKFTDKGKIEIILDSKYIGERLLVTIKIIDTGKGIEISNQNQLFNDYHQENESISTNYGGTGLGLSISKKLVELMGGEMSLESSVGKGSIFTIKIPFDYVSKKNQVLEQSEKITIKPKKILIVEDEIFNQIVLQTFLQKSGHEVCCVNNGKEALDILEDYGYSNFDCILMDINMPVMDGISATKIIRKKSNIKIIATTANAFLEDRQKCIVAGMDEYLPKPIEYEKLNELIKSLFSDG